MSLFKSDLSRNFGIGFLLGAVLVVMSAAPDWRAELAAPAQAATTETPAAR
ncbi:MAG: hypothetical protein ABJ239_05520 [Erythrobacter sp.]